MPWLSYVIDRKTTFTQLWWLLFYCSVFLKHVLLFQHYLWSVQVCSRFTAAKWILVRQYLANRWSFVFGQKEDRFNRGNVTEANKCQILLEAAVKNTGSYRRCFPSITCRIWCSELFQGNIHQEKQIPIYYANVLLTNILLALLEY